MDAGLELLLPLVEVTFVLLYTKCFNCVSEVQSTVQHLYLFFSTYGWE